MSEMMNFESIGVYIDNNLEQFAESILSLINIASQPDKVELHTLRFISGRKFDVKAPINLKNVMRDRIPIFDLIIYANLTELQKSKVTWVIDDNRKNYSETQISFSCLFIYFMLMTRNKITPNDNEQIPSFLERFMSVPMSVEDIKDCLSSNNLDKFNHKWIKNIKIDSLSLTLQNRFKQGIAGMRLFSVFRDFPIDKDVSANLQLIVSNIKKVAEEGPYWEMHNLFNTNNLRGMSVNANLNNLILECYTEDKIKDLIKMKAIYKYPNFNPRSVSYHTWSDSFFSEYKTKLFNP
jgi:hypothetical protein